MSKAKGLLVLRVEKILEREEHDKVGALLEPIAQALGVKALILGPGVDVEMHHDHSAQIDRICALLETLVAQGKPVLGEAQIAPQALNARSTGEGLNSRPTELQKSMQLDSLGIGST